MIQKITTTEITKSFRNETVHSYPNELLINLRKFQSTLNRNDLKLSWRTKLHILCGRFKSQYKKKITISGKATVVLKNGVEWGLTRIERCQKRTVFFYLNIPIYYLTRSLTNDEVTSLVLDKENLNKNRAHEN